MIEAFILPKLPAVIRPIVQALLGPAFAAADTVIATFRGDLTHVAQEPLVFLGAIVSAVNATAVHGGVWAYAVAYVTAAFRVFTSPTASSSSTAVASSSATIDLSKAPAAPNAPHPASVPGPAPQPSKP